MSNLSAWRNGIRTLNTLRAETNPKKVRVASSVVLRSVPWPISTTARVGQTRGLWDSNMQGSNPAALTNQSWKP